MGIGARILELRTQAGLNQADFGKLIGVTRSAICNYENGSRSVGKQVILSICREFGVTEDWLRDGTEPKFVDQPAFDLGDYVRQRGASDLETQILKAYFELDKDTRQKLLEHFKARLSSMPEGKKAGSETVAEAIAETVYFVVPGFISAMSAGTGQPAGSDEPEDLDLTKRPPHGTSYVASISGDSMEPTYHDGDKLFIRACEEIEVGQIGVFLMDGQQWVKELGDGVLISHNPGYDPIPMRDDIKCQGLVLGVCDESYFE